MSLRFLFLRASAAFVACLGFALVCLPGAAAANTNVRITTDLGIIDVELYDSLRPVSVSNFLNYVNDGDYDGSFIHRSIPGFVIQGGGFRFVNNVLGAVPTDAAFADVAGPSNLRGTIAMAEALDLATSQWFINLVDNPGLDASFTVFGEVTAGLDVVDQLALIPVYNGSGIHAAFVDLPLMNYTFPDDVVEANFVKAPITLPEPHGVAASWTALAMLATLARRRPKRPKRTKRARLSAH